MKRMFGLGAAISLMVLAGGCGGGGSEASATTAPAQTTAGGATRTITGTLTNTSLPCDVAGPNGWHEGDPVVILDGSGKLLAEGEITGPVGDRDQSTRCDLAWSVPDVPEGAPGYQVRAVDEDPVSYDWSELTDDPQLVKG